MSSADWVGDLGHDSVLKHRRINKQLIKFPIAMLFLHLHFCSLYANCKNEICNLGMNTRLCTWVHDRVLILQTKILKLKSI